MPVAPESASAPRRASRPASFKRWLALGVVSAAALAGVSFWWLGRVDAAHGRGSAGAEGTKGGKAATSTSTPTSETAERVDVIRPRAGGLLRQTVQPGSIHAFESVDLYAKVSGFLKTQTVDIGDAVKQGDVLATIEAPELGKDVEEGGAAVEQARARAALAEARRATAEAEREAFAAMVTQAEAEIARCVADRSLGEKQLERVKSLRSQNAQSQAVVDEQVHSVESARASERASRAAVLTAKAQLNAAAAKVLQSKADIDEAKTAIRLAEARAGRSAIMAGYTRIVAPFDGVVTARLTFPGDFIRAANEGGSVPLLTVKRTDRMRVVVRVPDTDVSLLDVGDPATIVVDALKGKSFSGKVSRLAHFEDSTTRTMRVEVDLPNQSGLLYEGMYGLATITLRPPSKGLALPDGCVVGHSRSGQARAYVVRDGHVHPVAVTLGDDDGSMTEVLDGLSPDDVVVLSPSAAPDEATPVVANPVTPAAPRPR